VVKLIKPIEKPSKQENYKEKKETMRANFYLALPNNPGRRTLRLIGREK